MTNSSSANPYKKALNHTVIYGIADVLRKVVGFLMLPIYTRYLTPEDYGVVELMLMSVFIMEVFLGMRMGQAIFRFYYLEKDVNEKKAVVSTAFFMTLGASTVAFLILFFNADKAALLVIGDTRYAELLSLFATLVITQALEAYGLVYLRIQQRAVLFLIVSAFKLVMQISLNVYFIIFLELSVAGVIYSSVITTALMAAFGAIYTLYYSGFRFSNSLLKQLVIFSYPLWIAVVGAFYVDASGKYFLRLFSGLDDVGIYSLALKFATIITVFVWSPFSNIWQSLRYEIHEMPESNKVYGKIFIILMFVFAFAGLGLSLFSDVIIRLMANEAFWSAGSIVPILTAATVVMSIRNFNNFGILLKGKTGNIAIGTYINVIVITVCFILLIPSFGMYGVAIAALIGALCQLLWLEWSSTKFYDMQLPWQRVFIIAATCVGCYAISFLLPEEIILSIIGRSLILIGFVWLVFMLPILENEEKEQILLYVKNAVTRVKKQLKFAK